MGVFVHTLIIIMPGQNACAVILAVVKLVLIVGAVTRALSQCCAGNRYCILMMG